MATIKGTLGSRSTRHSTVTDTAARVRRALLMADVLAHPGVINPRGGRGAARIIVTAEPGRIRISVSGAGHQELLVYGRVTRRDVVHPLEREFGTTAVTVRDPLGAWTEEPTDEAFVSVPLAPTN